MKLWAGRFSKETDKGVNDFNSSLPFDKRMYREDIEGSIAHASMLEECGIIEACEAKEIVAGLNSILEDIGANRLTPSGNAEDIHTFVEATLTERIGAAGKKLHTARSRNDQVALDLRLYLRKEIDEIKDRIIRLAGTLADKAEQTKDAVMPGYTHMQRAQPVTFAHYMCAYCEMLLRDLDRLCDCARRLNESPLGACALAATTHPINRAMTAETLGFERPAANSLDAVSDRDFVIELAADLSILMMHLSRLSEEIILWCSWEFKFIELDDAFSTGSSIMPQKKNPDVAELARGKTGRVYGSLFTLLTMMKGLPLAYDKDMQEDKEAIFDAIDNVKLCLEVFEGMVDTMKINREKMRAAASAGFINATDCADYLVGKGLRFRDAYKITGEIVAWCIEQHKTLETMTLDEYKTFTPAFEADVFAHIDLDACISGRKTFGGPAPEAVAENLLTIRQRLKKYTACTKGNT